MVKTAIIRAFLSFSENLKIRVRISTLGFSEPRKKRQKSIKFSAFRVVYIYQILGLCENFFCHSEERSDVRIPRKRTLYHNVVALPGDCHSTALRCFAMTQRVARKNSLFCQIMYGFKSNIKNIQHSKILNKSWKILSKQGKFRRGRFF